LNPSCKIPAFQVLLVKTKDPYLNVNSSLTTNLDQMKQFNRRLFIAAIVVAGLFVGAVKGQEARSRWVNKFRSREEGE